MFEGLVAFFFFFFSSLWSLARYNKSYALLLTRVTLLAVTRAKRPSLCWTPSSTSSPKTPAAAEARRVKPLSTGWPMTCWTSCRQTMCPLRWRSACRRWESCSPWTSSCARRLTACRRSSCLFVPPWTTWNWPSTAPSSWARTWGTRWTACTTPAFPACGERSGSPLFIALAPGLVRTKGDLG